VVSLESMLDSILEGFQIVDEDLRYVFVNSTAARHGRTTREALLGRTMQECYPGIEDTEVAKRIRVCLDKGISSTLENEFQFPDGTIGFFELRIERVPRGACILSIDISEKKQAEAAQKRAEERLQQAQKMEAVGQLAASIAHDFNNLITIVQGQGELALTRAEGPRREDVEQMLSAVRSASELTRQLLTFGRRTVVQRTEVDVDQMVRAFAPILEHALRTETKQIQLEIEASASHHVLADRHQLEQVLLNLVLNARDAIRERGCVRVCVREERLDTLSVVAYPGMRPGRQVVLCVQDDGEGMDAETAQRVFEPFFTTKERGRGTGLGLSTVYGIVKQHDGHVWLYTEPNRGTTFKVYLPRVQEPQPEIRPQPPLKSDAVEARRCILVAEDAPLLRKLLHAVLESAGHEALMATTGTEALALFAERPERVDLLITDVMLPGMSGPELVAKARALRPELPVICTSGYSDLHLAGQRALPDGVLFVEKPFSPKQLLEKVSSLLRGS
jgi:two-component system, cell cycle sensor histidine kinase and response regulator CckA